MEYNGEAITKVRARELYNEADQKVLNTAFINTEIKNAEKHIQRADAVTGKLTERANRNAEFYPLRITNASFTFTGTPFQVLFRVYQMP